MRVDELDGDRRLVDVGAAKGEPASTRRSKDVAHFWNALQDRLDLLCRVVGALERGPGRHGDGYLEQPVVLGRRVFGPDQVRLEQPKRQAQAGNPDREHQETEPQANRQNLPIAPGERLIAPLRPGANTRQPPLFCVVLQPP